MVRADDRLLEYLLDHGPASPSKIVSHERIDMSRTHANTRLSIMAETELVEMVGNGVYRITEVGEEYLAGKIDARDLEEPE